MKQENRRQAALVVLCLGLAVVVNIVVPYMHPLVHGIEAFAAALAVLAIRRLSGRLETREREIAEMTERAARTERMAALTAFAAGAAHELATPLGTIAVVAGELARSADPAVVADARLVRAEIDRCRAIVDEMAGSRGETLSALSIPALLEDIIERLPLSRRGRLTVRWETTTLTMVAPRQGLSQALASLIKNAFDASDDAGAVVLGVGRNDDAVELVVRDEGCGMDAATLAHAGEPFFTTRPDGEGRGLGLFVARQLAEGLGGRLWVESQAGAGTTVMLRLPQPSQPSSASVP